MIWYRTALLALTFAVALSVGARASTLTLSFNTVWTGATPAGTPDVAILTMQDVSNGVLITLTHSPNSAAGQSISKLNLRFYRQPTGADFTGDPFVVSIGAMWTRVATSMLRFASKLLLLRRVCCQGEPPVSGSLGFQWQTSCQAILAQ